MAIAGRGTRREETRQAAFEKPLAILCGTVAVMAQRRKGRGGRREGAGRKPVIERAVTTSFEIAERDLESLRELAATEDRSVGDLMREAVRRFLARRKRG